MLGKGRHMVKIELIDRKGSALTPSAIRCLSWMPTVNITAGCAHGCIYCYIKGYSGYPGDGVVRVYRNTAAQVAQELKRKRRKTIAVYFCPSSDAFQPIPEVRDQSFDTMHILLENHVGVQFVTKGVIPDRFFELFARFPQLVSGQIGLCTLDQTITDILEPAAAPVAARFDQLTRFVKIGIQISARADPLIHGVTDTDDLLRPFLATVRQTGVIHFSASYLFLRPAIRSSLVRNIVDPIRRQSVLAPYVSTAALGLRGGDNLGQPLPTDLRRAGFDRIRDLADEFGLTLHICGCKNADLTDQRCNLTQLTVAGREHLQQQRAVAQESLWQ